MPWSATSTSVGLDFLYLRTERPLFLTDRRNDLPALLAGAPIAAAADVVDDSSVGHLGALVRRAMARGHTHRAAPQAPDPLLRRRAARPQHRALPCRDRGHPGRAGPAPRGQGRPERPQPPDRPVPCGRSGRQRRRSSTRLTRVQSSGYLAVSNAEAGSSDDGVVQAALAELEGSGPVIRAPSDDAGLDTALRGADGACVVVLGGDGSLHRVVHRLHRPGGWTSTWDSSRWAPATTWPAARHTAGPPVRGRRHRPVARASGRSAPGQ